MVQFIVDDNGEVGDIQALQTVDAPLSKLAVQAIRESGPWVPATQNKYKVNSYRRQLVSLQF